MGAKLTKQALDVGIVVADGEQMLAFYRDVLGFKHVLSRETGPGGTIHQLACGQSLIKLLEPPSQPGARHARGGTRAQTGLRYVTIYVSNIDELVPRLEAAGCHFPVPLKDSTGGGSRYTQVEDPEGNIVQLQQNE